MSIPVGWGNLKEIMKNRLWQEPVLEITSKKILLVVDFAFFLAWVLDLKEDWEVLTTSYHLHHTWFTASCLPSSTQQSPFAWRYSRCLLSICYTFECCADYSNIEFNKMIYIWHKENKNRTVYSRTINIYSEEIQSQILLPLVIWSKSFTKSELYCVLLPN